MVTPPELSEDGEGRQAPVAKIAIRTRIEIVLLLRFKSLSSAPLEFYLPG